MELQLQLDLKSMEKGYFTFHIQISRKRKQKHTLTLAMSPLVYSFFLFVRPCHRVVHCRVSQRNNQNGYQTSLQADDRQKEDEKVYTPSIRSL